MLETDPKELEVYAKGDGYEIFAPIYEDGPRLRIKVFGDLLIRVESEAHGVCAQYTFGLTPLAAHALAEALHATANIAEGKPSDAPFTMVDDDAESTGDRINREARNIGTSWGPCQVMRGCTNDASDYGMGPGGVERVVACDEHASPRLAHQS